MTESQGPTNGGTTPVHTTTINPRSYGAERRYTGASVAELAALRDRLIAAGASDQVASGLVGWIVGKAAAQRDLTSAPTRARYRRLLEELDGPLTEEERQAPIIFGHVVTSTSRRWGRRAEVLAGAAA